MIVILKSLFFYFGVLRLVGHRKLTWRHKQSDYHKR